jgi:hypothetical protein
LKHCCQTKSQGGDNGKEKESGKEENKEESRQKEKTLVSRNIRLWNPPE